MSLARYTRQTRLPEIGVLGQQKLMRAFVVPTGTVDVAAMAATYLQAAGVGALPDGSTALPVACDPAFLGLEDEAAQTLGHGAVLALMAIRGILGMPSSDPAGQTDGRL